MSAPRPLTKKEMESKAAVTIGAKVQIVVVGKVSYRREGDVWMPYAE